MANNTELNTGPFIWGAAQNAAGQPDDTIARTGPDISRETFMDDTFRAFMLLYRSGVWHKGMNADLLDGQHADEFQPICATLTALCALSSYGLVAKTAADTIAARTITASATAGREGIAITNGDGVSGNPEVGLNISGLTADTTLNATDEFPYRDATSEGNNKIDASNLAAQLAALGGYATTATAVTAASAFTAANRVIVAGGADRSADDSDFTMTQDGTYVIGVAGGSDISFGANQLTTTGGLRSGAHENSAADGAVARTLANDATHGEKVLHDEVTTTDATVTTVIEFALPTDSCTGVSIVVIGRESPGADYSSHRRYTATFYEEGGLTLEDSQQDYSYNLGALPAVTIDVNGANGRVRVTGIAATTIRWHCKVVFDWRTETA